MALAEGSVSRSVEIQVSAVKGVTRLNGHAPVVAATERMPGNSHDAQPANMERTTDRDPRLETHPRLQ